MQPLYRHLDELRTTFMRVSAVLLVLAVVCIAFARWLIQNLTELVSGVTFISISPFEFLVAQVKAGLFLAIIIAIPYIVFEIALFIRPALRKQERRFLYSFIPVSLLLFAVGFLLSYFIILKYSLLILADISTANNIVNMWSISRFVSFVFFTCLFMGLLFQIPIILLTLVKTRLISLRFISHKRKYIYLASFIFAALITPPDVITQIALALPMIVLFELGVMLSRFA